MNRFLLLGLLLASVLGSSGCSWHPFKVEGNDRIDIEPSDQERLHPGASLTWQAFPRDGPPKQGLFDLAKTAPSPPSDGSFGASLSSHEPELRRRARAQPTLSVDVDYRLGVAGQDDQSLRGGDFVDYDGTRFLTPQKVKYDYELHLATVGVRGGVRFVDMFAIEGIAGLSTGALHLVLRDPGQRAGDTGVGIGGNVGMRGTITPHPVFDLYGQFQTHLLGLPKNNRGTAIILTAEVGSQINLTPNVSLFGGWRWSSYNESIDHGSNLDVDISGPAFGLLIRL